MRSIVQIALQDLRIFFGNRGNLVGLLVIPITMTVILGIFIPSGQGPSRVRVDVVDHDRGPAAEDLLAVLRQANSSLVLCPMDNDPEDFCRLGEEPELDAERAVSRVQEGDSLVLIEIPIGFSQSVQLLETTAVRYVSVGGFSGPGYVQQALQAALTQINGSVVAARVGGLVAEDLGLETDFARGVYQRAADLWHAEPITVQYQLTAEAAVDPTTTQDIGGFGQSVPGMGSMMVLFTVLGAMGILVGEKKQWTIQRLATMPITRAQLLGGKILGRFTLGILQYLVVFSVGIVAGISFGRDLLALALVMVAFTLASTALSFAIGSRLTSEQQAAGLANLLGLTLAPLGGAWWPLEVVPESMRVVGHISPIAWAMDGYTALMFRNGTLSDVTLSIAVLLGMALLFFVYGIRRFSYRL